MPESANVARYGAGTPRAARFASVTIKVDRQSETAHGLSRAWRTNAPKRSGRPDTTAISYERGPSGTGTRTTLRSLVVDAGFWMTDLHDDRPARGRKVARNGPGSIARQRPRSACGTLTGRG